ncbi:MAG TPA: GGDEF domain-containing protein [Isosphaeraceae bacterium]|nr:GGDEF domain-containing protein [Isosphaeraceae bacterium]
MNESTMSERNWRLDEMEAASSERAQEPGRALETRSVVRSRACGLARWKQRAAHWAKKRAACFKGLSVKVSAHEQLMHDLGKLVAQVDDFETIEKSLLQSVATMTGSSAVQWAKPSDPSPAAREGRLVLELCAGMRSYGRLLVQLPKDGFVAISPTTLERLKTLCTLAALALCQHERPAASAARTTREAQEDSLINATQSALGLDASADRDSHSSIAWGNQSLRAPIQDATFLNAVLPFAVGQARRHNEPISLLCVSVDRLSGIHELLGKHRAHQAVHNVGVHIAGMIRETDIVARLDDDRIVVVLPRARIADAVRIGQKICRTIETNSNVLPELPALTVSIGTAEYPSCADNFYALLDAADHALTKAVAQGRNRAVAAALLSEVPPAPAPVPCAS